VIVFNASAESVRELVAQISALVDFIQQRAVVAARIQQ
jgi:hypothetical protein